MRYFS